MPETTNKAVTLAKSRLSTLFNYFKPPNIENNDVSKYETTTMMTDDERLILQSSSRSYSQADGVNALSSSMQQVSDDISRHICENKSYMSMLPEADKAKSILIPSILSPTDMYGHNISVSINTPTVVDEEVKLEITNIISAYINEELNIGDKLSLWIGDALFEKGATPVMVVPRKLISVLAKEESDKLKETDAEAYGKCRIGSEGVGTSLDDIKLDGSFSKNSDITPDFGKIEFAIEDLAELIDTNTVSKTTSVKKMSSVMKTVSDQISVSLDYTKITNSTESAKIINKNVADRIGGHKVKLGGNNMLSIDGGHMSSDGDADGIVLRLPTSSVFPIIIPGSPEAKLGYVVAIDSSGNPLDSDVVSATETSLSTASFMTHINTTSNNLLVSNIAAEEKSANASRIFELVIKNILGSSLSEIGLSKGTVSNQKELAACVFGKVLRKQQISFIFVPPSNMAYFAYQFRADGTGKTLLEDASTLVSLRTACIVAKVVSLMSNATDQHHIEYTIPDASATNVKQMNSIIHDAYVDKNMFVPSHDPIGIYRDIVRRSVQISPKEMNGIKDFSINTETTQRSLSNVDNELEEMFGKMITQFLHVPASAIDDTHEKEFSRSVATSNILFSNSVRVFQGKTCTELDVLIKSATKNSSKVVREVANVLVASEHGKVGDGSHNTNDIVWEVLDSIKTSLPKPNVSPDKARLSEISEQIRTIGEIVDSMWPEELIVSEEDRELRTALTAIKAMLKQSKVRELINNCGDSSLTNIPELGEIDFNDIRKVNQVVVNLKAMLDRMKDGMKPTGDEEASSGGSRW